MFNRLDSVWSRFGSDRSGFPLGTALLLTLILSVWVGGVQDSLCVTLDSTLSGLQVYRLSLHVFSHEELPSLLYNCALLLLFGRCQERRWGTVAFLGLSVLSTALPVLLYTFIIVMNGTQSGHICGYSVTQLVMFTAQCRNMKQRRFVRWVPLWSLPPCLLLLNMLLLPNPSFPLHACGIVVGLCYTPAIIGWLQQGEVVLCQGLLPDWAFVATFPRELLPTRSSADSLVPLPGQPAHWKGPHSTPLPSPIHPLPDWTANRATNALEAQLLDEEMLNAGILASLQDNHESPVEKVLVPKSSVSSLRLQQLEQMGFPTEKAVVALAATGKLDGAISLLIDDRVGEEAVVMSKGRRPTLPNREGVDCQGPSQY